MVDFHPIIYRGRKQCICLCPLGYHTARTQEIVKSGRAVNLDPLQFTVSVAINYN